MQKYFFLIGISALLAFSACEKDDRWVKVEVGVVSCCNFFEDEAYRCGQETVEEAVICAFGTEGIPFQNLHMKDTGPVIVCFTCCGCPTGETLYLEVYHRDLERVMDWGFVRS